jgi:hypothetical protein
LFLQKKMALSPYHFAKTKLGCRSVINRSRRAEGKRATSSKKRNRLKKLNASDPQSEQMQQKRQGRWQACHQLRLLWFVHDETCHGANKSDGAAWRELPPRFCNLRRVYKNHSSVCNSGFITKTTFLFVVRFWPVRSIILQKQKRKLVFVFVFVEP